MKKIVVWYNPNKQIYYYRYIHDIFNRYFEGYVNQYSHKVIMTIDLYKEIIYRPKLKNKVLSRLIRFLQRLNK